MVFGRADLDKPIAREHEAAWCPERIKHQAQDHRRLRQTMAVSVRFAEGNSEYELDVIIYYCAIIRSFTWLLMYFFSENFRMHKFRRFFFSENISLTVLVGETEYFGFHSSDGV